jgi:hypothetical protein
LASEVAVKTRISLQAAAIEPGAYLLVPDRPIETDA